MGLDSPNDILLVSIAGGLLLAAGVALLRRRWLERRSGGLARLILGWASIVAGFVAWSEASGAELGITFAAGALSLAAYAVVAATAERRTQKVREPRDVALDPEERPTNWPRGIAKSLLAIVLSGIASIGIGVAFAVAMPWPPQDKAVVGGLLVPILWGAGMAWTLCDPRLVRATIVLVTVSAIGYGIAFLPKVLS